MLGTQFKRTLRAAQVGDEDAFAVLWRDANPAVVRYLRVLGLGDPYDGASEGWITVARSLSDFSGDEIAWRVWVLACARGCAEERGAHRTWSSLAGREHGRTHRSDSDEAPLDLQEIKGDETSDRGLEYTMTALQRLPLGQGEVLILRLGAGLPVGSVAEVVGTDSVAVRRSETRGLERLGADRDLVAWSLAAPATARELADERVASAAYRSLVPLDPDQRSPRTRVIAFAPVAGSRRRPGWGLRKRPQHATMTGRAAPSRAAPVAAVAVSVWVALFGFGAAAYAGVLPDRLQSALHDSIGVRAPRTDHPSRTTPAPKGTG